MPGGVLHQPAAQGRPEQRPDQPRQRDEGHDPHEFAARKGAQHHQPPNRQHQRSAQRLQHAGCDELVEAGGQRAEQRTQGEQHDGCDEDPPAAEAIGNPARCRNQQRHREHVGDHHTLHAQRVLGQVAGHRRQRGIENGAVQRLHEKRDGHQPRQDSRGTGIESYGRLHEVPGNERCTILEDSPGDGSRRQGFDTAGTSAATPL